MVVKSLANLKQETVSAAFLAGVRQLLRAHDFAQEFGLSAASFAVEITRLRQLGMDECEVRWLVQKGFIEHYFERWRPEQVGRMLTPIVTLGLSQHSCFALTDHGAEFARSCLQVPRNGPDNGGAGGPLVANTIRTPTWNAELRQLRLGNRIVKSYRVPAPRQEAILNAFQEAGWPPRLEYPRQGTWDQKESTRIAIRSLNRNQRPLRIRFLGDGSGTGIRWELVGRQQARGQSARS